MSGARAESADFLERVFARAPDEAVCLGPGAETIATLRDDAARVCAALPPPSEGSELLLVVKGDRYAAAAGALGVLLRGHALALAPEGGREAIMAVLSRPSTVGLLHDTAAGLPLRLEGLLGQGPAPTPPARVGGRICVYAWGPEGALAREALDEATLCRRLRALAARLGHPARVVGAARPAEPEGLFASVLLPLYDGGAFARAPVADAEALAAQARELEADCLLAPPRLLRGLARLPAGNLPSGCTLATPGASEARAEALEEALCALEGVEDAGVLCVGERAYACVVAGPNARLEAAAEATLGAGARVWRSDRVPRLEGGALDRATLLRPFGLGASGAPLCFALTLGATREEHEGARRLAERSVCIPPDYGGFEGHFPGYPILAGALQLKELVLPFVREVFPELGSVRAMSRIKFTGRILPGDTLRVRLSREGEAVSFAIDKGDAACSSGLLTFGGPA